MKEMKEALNKHNSTFIYEQLVSVGDEGRKVIVDLAIDEFLEKKLDGDNEGAERILLSLVHASVSADELGMALYDRGYDDALTS